MKPSQSQRTIAAVRALCGLNLHAEVLVPAVLEALHQLVPSYRNLFDWCDEQGRLVRYFIEGPVDAAIAQLYFDEFHNRREAEAMPPFGTLSQQPLGVRGADELDTLAFYNSALYHEIWRPQGFRWRIEAVLRGRRGQLLGSLVLYRGPGERRFSRDDEQLLASVLPALAAALEACGPAQADDRHVPSPDPPETLLLTLAGELRHASDGAQRLLMLADGGLSREALTRPTSALAGRLVPMVLAQLHEQALGDAGQGPSPPPPSITHENRFGQFVATGRLLRPARADAEPLAQLTLRRLEPHRVALDRALRASPITPGQMAVCRGLYHGRSQGEIAAELGVATATVIDHVRKAYRALDVASAIELRAALDQRVAGVAA